MTRVKILKILMLLILVVFVGVVITNYRTGKTISDTTTDEELSRLVAGEQIIQKEFNQKNYQKEKLESEISAREIVNYQDGVNVLEDFHFTRSEDGVEVRSDFGRGRLDKENGDAFLWENVQIRDGQGMTISTAAAMLHQSSGMLAGDKPVSFSDSRLFGSSLGVLYNMNTGVLQLPALVDLTITGDQDSSVEPVSVRAGFLKLVREPGIAYLARGVHLQQGRLSLNCRTLLIQFEEAGRRILHASAFGDVVFEMAAESGEGDSPEKGAEGMRALGEDPGRKTLHASQLEIFFPRDATETARLEYLVARGTRENMALLRLYTQQEDGTPDGAEIRQIEGERFVFRFRHDGPPNRLDSFHAQGGCLLRLFDAGAPGARQPEEVRLAGEILAARFDPVRQDLKIAEISGNVLFSRGQEHIRGQLANFDAASGLLVVTGEENGRLPKMWNDTVVLEAVKIIYSVDGQLLEAEEDVWVQVEGQDGTRGLDVSLFSEGNEEEPIYIHADRLESDLEAGVSSFQGTVRVLKGENVLSARNLWLYHQDRRMEALERVSLIIHPLADGGDALENTAEATAPAVQQLAESLSAGTEVPTLEEGESGEEATDGAFDRSAPLQITCDQMTYDDQARYIILDQRVKVSKHKTRLNADHMEIQLDREENRILHIIASAVGAGTPDAVQTAEDRPELLISGFDSQRHRRHATGILTLPDDSGTGNNTGTQGAAPGSTNRRASGLTDGAGGADGSRAVASGRPQVPQVTLSQPGGRSATAERVLYYPGEQIAVLVGIDTIATIVDPRSGSAQGTSLTYHLADGKILNRAKENEVTLVLLHAGSSTTDLGSSGSAASTRGARGRRATSTRSAGAGPTGRSTSR